MTLFRDIRDEMRGKPKRPSPHKPVGMRGLGGVGSVVVPRIKRNDDRHSLPDPVTDPDGYLLECQRRMNEALAMYAAIEGRIGELYRYWVDRMGGQEYEGWLQIKKYDPEATRLFSLRENSRERARTYAAVIQAQLALRGVGLS